jgi:hypothetical protein
MAVDKTFFRVVGRVFVATAYLCKKQWVMTKCGASFFTKVAEPDVLASLAGAPSVQRVWSFSFQSKFCLAKNLLPFSKRRRPSWFPKGTHNIRIPLDGVSMHIANKDKELATLRDVCSFNQLHTEGEWRGCQEDSNHVRYTGGSNNYRNFEVVVSVKDI